jgi:arsenate reductase (thioredoxin)
MSKRNGRKRVLFVCIGNACRSPMAEAIARRDASDALEASSAGLAPLGFVAAMTKQTLVKNGCSVEGLESKTISRELWEQADIVINMSGRAFRELSKVEDWEIEDPFGEDREVFQRVFEKIRLRVTELAQRCRLQDSEEASPSPVAAPTSPGADPPITAPRTYAPWKEQSAEKALQFRSKTPRDQGNSAGEAGGRLATFALWGLVIGLFSLTFEWILIQRDVRSEALTAATQKAAIPSDAVQPVAPLPATTPPSLANLPTEKAQAQTSNVEHLPAEKVETVRSTSSGNAPPPINAGRKSTPSIVVKAPSHHADNELRPGKSTNEPPRIVANVKISPVQKTQTQPVLSAPPAPPQLEAKTVQPADPLPLSSSNARPAEPHREETSVAPAKRPPTPAAVTAAITIQADPYPSLRIPDGRSSKKQRQGTSLQLGHLLSRVEPVYPEEAKQQGIEGTVKIHAIIGRNGSVADLPSVNGPPVLVASAANAVRQWRYTETLLAGQSVETEEDIDVIFRLSGPAASKK